MSTENKIKKIEKLTDDQTVQLDIWARKWIDIGLSTEPADFETATKASLAAYELCNLKRPMIILHMSSPYAATIGGFMAIMILKNIKKISNLSLKDQVRNQVRNQVWSQVNDQVNDQVKESVWNYGVSSLTSDLSAWATCFRDVFNLKIDKSTLDRLDINEAIVKSCGWTWWHENVLAISDRPSIINRDAENRLHCENGPSIAYRDGWALYHWHGVSIPKEWVTGQKPTASQALSWSNIEQRRAAVEIVGWSNILKELDTKIIDESNDPEIGVLLEATIPDSGAERFLKVMCGTKREFILSVPREMQTALEANAWTYGLMPNEYAPEIRT